MKRLAVLPSDPIGLYLSSGYSESFLRTYYNPARFFDEVYLFAPEEPDNPDQLGMRAIRTRPHELPQRLREYDIDIVRAYGGYWAADMACHYKVSGVPVVVSVHDKNPVLLHNSIRRADLVFCAEPLRDFVATKFPDRRRLWVLPNGVDFHRMRPYDRQDVRDLEEKYPFRHRLLQVGRRERQKNLETLIRALTVLGADYGLVTAGKGDAAPYRRLAQDEGVLDRCVFLESISNEEMARFFSWADCLCHPTRWEGMSLLLTEALASEAVIVASDIPEVRDLITHGHNGLLVPQYENPDALAEAVRRACTNDPVRRELKANARRSVARFELGAVQNLEADYYDRLLGMKRAGQFRVSRGHQSIRQLEQQARRRLPRGLKRTIKRLLPGI